MEPLSNRSDYLEALRAAICRMEKCAAVHKETVHVHEAFQGQTVWKGDVEVFDLVRHPNAKHAYAWAHLDGPNNEKTRFMVILEIAPVKDAQTAVQASLMALTSLMGFRRPPNTSHH